MTYDSKNMLEHLFHITFKNMDFQQFTEHISAFLAQYMPLFSLGLYEFTGSAIKRMAFATCNEEFFNTPEYLVIDKQLLRRIHFDPDVTGNIFGPRIFYGDTGNPHCNIFNKLHPNGGASIYLPLECDGARRIFYLSAYTLGRDHYTPEHLELCREILPMLNKAFFCILGRKTALATPDAASSAPDAPPDGRAPASPRFTTLDEHIAAYIRQAIAHTGGRISGPGGAARLLGLPASTLWSKIRKYGIDIAKKR